MRTANLKEWIGKTDDSRPPPYVRLRVFNKYQGICYLSERKIVPGEKWHVEHIVALCNGGENRESNMAPALVAPHKIKTKQDRATKAKNDHVRQRHLGIKKPRTITRWRKMNGEPVFAARER
jgi:5-methylcytosine-specific restriction protein A